MRRLLQAPNLVLATLWADMLQGVGIATSVQRAWTGSIVGELPPDQALPEIWVHDDRQAEAARALLRQWQHEPHRCWRCRACGESVEGPFDQCWNCLAQRPADHSAAPG